MKVEEYYNLLHRKNIFKNLLVDRAGMYHRLSNEDKKYLNRFEILTIIDMDDNTQYITTGKLTASGNISKNDKNSGYK